MGTKYLEDVPEDRPTADLHHRLGLEVGFLADSGAEATGKNDGFHKFKREEKSLLTVRVNRILNNSSPPYKPTSPIQSTKGLAQEVH